MYDRGMSVASPDRRLDLDTQQKGVEGPFESWEGDHTALVHVLWHARSDGLIPRETDCDDLASRIMRSRWMAAARAEGPLRH